MKGGKEQSAFIAVAYKMKIIPASLQVHEQIIVYALNAELSSERKIYFSRFELTDWEITF